MSFKEIKSRAKDIYKKEVPRNVSVGFVSFVFKFAVIFLIATIQFVCVQIFGNSFAYGYPSLIFYLFYAMALFLVILPTNFGVATYYAKAVKGKSHCVNDVFNFFSKNLSKAVGCQIYLVVSIFMATIAFVVAISVYLGSNAESLTISPGVLFGAAVIILLYILIMTVIALKYCALAFCCEKYPNLPVEKVISKAVRLVKGSKFELFLLLMSNIGWMLLGVITCGIGFIWIKPYLKILTNIYLTTLERSF